MVTSKFFTIERTWVLVIVICVVNEVVHVVNLWVRIGARPIVHKNDQPLIDINH